MPECIAGNTSYLVGKCHRANLIKSTLRLSTIQCRFMNEITTEGNIQYIIRLWNVKKNHSFYVKIYLFSANHVYVHHIQTIC